MKIIEKFRELYPDVLAHNPMIPNYKCPHQYNLAPWKECNLTREERLDGCRNCWNSEYTEDENTQRLNQLKAKFRQHEGSTVLVKEPKPDDPWNHEFIGTLIEVHEDYFTVRDQEDNCWDIDFDMVEITQ